MENSAIGQILLEKSVAGWKEIEYEVIRDGRDNCICLLYTSKNFPVKSPEIGRQIGAVVLKGCKVLKVDVHHPDCLLFVDVRHDKSYIYQDKIAEMCIRDSRSS